MTECFPPLPAQVESLLKAQEKGESSESVSPAGHCDQSDRHQHDVGADSLQDQNAGPHVFPTLFESSQDPGTSSGEENFSQEMIELGYDEALPSQEVLDELFEIYFDKVHPSAPMVHRYRFLAAMNLSPSMRPPIALRYAMWTLAASITNKFKDLHEHFYTRARKYAELAEMTGHGEKVTSTAHTQAWVLIAKYEFRMMHFPRAWLSTGRAIRLAQMMGMHRLDSLGLDVKQTLLPPRDWVEKEERRRTFWMTFCLDTYATVGTGWPMTIDERDILTNLPCSEEAYEHSIETQTMSLVDARTPASAADLSPSSGVVVVASLFRRTLLHLHRSGPDDREDDLNGEFWKRHRNMDSILLNTFLFLPVHLRLPLLQPSPDIIFLNMAIHAATICLHQVAIFKAEKHGFSSTVGKESKIRCITAAAEVAQIMKMVASTDLTTMNPFSPFCLYVAARVLIQYVVDQPDDDQARSSVKFLLTAIAALKSSNPLADSFLVQLDVEVEGSGMDAPGTNTRSAAEKQQCMAGAFDEPHRDESPWAKIVSPLVMIVEQTEGGKYPTVGSSAQNSGSLLQKSSLPVQGNTKKGFSAVLPQRSASTSTPPKNGADEIPMHKFVRPKQPVEFDSLSAGSVQSNERGGSSSNSNKASPASNSGGPSTSSLPYLFGVRDGASSGELATSTMTSTTSYFNTRDLPATGISATGLSAETQAYMGENASPEDMFPITQEAWDFGMMNVSEDIYDSLMNMAPTDWDNRAP